MGSVGFRRTRWKEIHFWTSRFWSRDLMCGRPAPYRTTRHLNGGTRCWTLIWLTVSRKIGRRVKSRNMAPYERRVRRGSILVHISFENQPLRYEGFAKCRKGCWNIVLIPIIYVIILRGGSVGWATALQAGRSRVRFPMMSLEFVIDLILPSALWPLGRLSL